MGDRDVVNSRNGMDVRTNLEQLQQQRPLGSGRARAALERVPGGAYRRLVEPTKP